MAKNCIGNVRSDIANIEGSSDEDIVGGLSSHADPRWWKQDYVQRTNQAYLRRWGAYLRREARRRGLL